MSIPDPLTWSIRRWRQSVSSQLARRWWLHWIMSRNYIDWYRALHQLGIHSSPCVVARCPTCGLPKIEAQPGKGRAFDAALNSGFWGALRWTSSHNGIWFSLSWKNDRYRRYENAEVWEERAWRSWKDFQSSSWKNTKALELKTYSNYRLLRTRVA